jgi:hypothetical protein
MTTRSEPVPALLNREGERAALDGLLEDLRSGRGRALVVRGEAGVGKSALLEYVAGAAADMRVARAAGVESEVELAFAGLHLLCAPLLDRLDGLPGPQRDALGVAFGLRAGGAPDRFLVGLAVLTLLAEVAEDRPLLCMVDDAQWLDQASAQVLAFAARRLLAEPVGLIFAAREPGEQFGGLAELEVRGLPDKDARALLRSAVRFGLDEQVLDRIVAETNGNPLALLELPHGLGPAQLAGGFGLAGRYRRGSSRASGSGWRRFRPIRGRCCWSRRPSRPATRCCSGGRPGGSGSRTRPRRRPGRTGCCRSGRGCGSGIRWCGRRCTRRRRCRSGARRTWRWPR